MTESAGEVRGKHAVASLFDLHSVDRVLLLDLYSKLIAVVCAAFLMLNFYKQFRRCADVLSDTPFDDTRT